MRTGLEKLYSRKKPVRRVFSGEFRNLSIGSKSNRPVKLLLLENIEVRENGSRVVVADHVWITLPGTFVVPRHLSRETAVVFTGLVARYTRGFGRNREIDYKIDDVEDVVLTTG